MTETVADRRVAEPEVPQSVIDAFENRYHNHFDLTRDDHVWRNVWRYKHDHVQSHWAGWRDSWLATRSPTGGREAGLEENETPTLDRMVTIKTDHGEAVVNIDLLAKIVAKLADESVHERKMGWQLEAGFYSTAFNAVLAPVTFTYAALLPSEQKAGS